MELKYAGKKIHEVLLKEGETSQLQIWGIKRIIYSVKHATPTVQLLPGNLEAIPHSKNKWITLQSNLNVGCFSCTGTLIPIIVLVIQLIIDTISNLPIYEIQLLHKFDNTHIYAQNKWYVQLRLFVIHKLVLTNILLQFSSIMRTMTWP